MITICPHHSNHNSAQNSAGPDLLANRAYGATTGSWTAFGSLMASVSIGLIRLYQKTWFLRQPSCRFYPSCSQYMATSVERFGFFPGLFAGSLRILRCHPFHPGGIDMVPQRFSDHNFRLNLIPGMRDKKARGEG